MKATGIVRRIDDLGRVVIPKEIRRTMRIREGDPLEIYTDREGEVIFKKYSPIGELASFASQYADTLHRVCSLSVVITDRDTVIATAGVPKKDCLEKPVSPELEHIMEGRTLVCADAGDSPREIPVVRDASPFRVSCVMPILSEGDVIGCVASVFDPAARKPDVPDSDIETKLILTAAGFLGRQMEG